MQTMGFTPWLVTKPDPKARMRLFCFPYAGGSAMAYRAWSRLLPATVELCPVQPPGRGSRLSEKPYTKMGQMVETATEALEPYFDRPFAFFGHSMGAIIAFESALLLRREGKAGPLHLFVSGRRAPQTPDTIAPTYNLPEPEFLEMLRRLGGTPKEVLEHPELMQLMLPLLRADFELIQTYSYSQAEPLSCPITAFGGLQDPDVSQPELKAWGEQTTSNFLMWMLPGDHFFLHSSQHLLLSMLRRELEQIVAALK